MKTQTWKSKSSIIVATAIGIFLLVILVLALPFQSWGLKTDDFGTIYTSQKICSQGIKQIFSTGNIEALFYPSGSPINKHKQSFLSGLYRPGTLMWYYPQYKIFGTNVYWYFFIAIALHALNSGLFFILLLSFFSFFSSIFLALLFAFHPSLANWIGWVSGNHTYFADLLFLQLIFFCMHKVVLSRSYLWYSLSLIMYAFAIFMKETSIVLPFLITVALFLYYKYNNTSTPIKKSLSISSSFWGIAIIYCGVRAYIMGLNAHFGTFTGEGTLGAYLQRISGRFFDLVTYVSDLFMLSWLPHNHQIIKGSLITLIGAALIYLFYKNKNKVTLLFLFLSTISFSWTIILIHYQPRYIYIVLPISLLAGGMLIKPLILVRKKTYIQLASLVFIFIHAGYIIKSMKKRELIFGSTTQAFVELLNKPEIKYKEPKQPIAFISLPNHWFSMANAQAIWLLAKDDSFEVYELGGNAHLSWQKSYLDKPFSRSCKIEIEETNSGFKLKSLSPKLLAFQDNKKEILCAIPEKIKKQKPLIVMWDYTNGGFQIVKNYGKN